MMFWKYARIPFLMLVFGGTLFALGKELFSPLPKQQQVKTVFSEQVSLAGWLFLASKPLTDPIGRTYQYKQGHKQLTIEMRYAADLLSNEKPFRDYDPTVTTPVAPGQPRPILRQHDATGAYGLSVQDGKAYLRSCINPRGKAAVTYTQFIQNRYTVDLQPSRFVHWLTGQQPLRDYRCLWAYFSIPLEGSPPEAAYQTLEKTWPTWYQWWQANFPTL
ncbi:cyanoexosortase A system-associated protein [Phormidium sp. CLA17]|uniref:cyanoexosortase A system-associated protein n=1 Tax=Leptolyngbya sp. Cla-17 TaxID=2803751 RepID=UPI001490BBCF|nr:cyanoexosortase A system-associated protein [Leptolyngbya sp. Cla-17]MBM0744710.1 cyanoexosortase A system-associated protein [Leptolyngbya sp. Cla-17]